MLRELPEELPIIPFPLGDPEYSKNRIAREYNSLSKSDPKRKDAYQRYKDADLEASFD